MAVQMEVLYEGSLGCKGTHGPSGAVVETQAPLDNGGRGDSFSPTDLLATALGSCMLTIMGLAAKKEELDIQGTSLRVVKEMVAAPQRRVGKLSVQIQVVTTVSVNAGQKILLENAARTCPVALSLHPDVGVPTEFIYEVR